MITATIDGQQVTVAEGTNIVEAALKIGVEIPTYCYHPGLSVVGQCRICFVEVEGMPRLVTACSTPLQDEMVVLTSSARVRAAMSARWRKGVRHECRAVSICCRHRDRRKCVHGDRR